MDNRDLPSDSDSSDEDFVPEGADSDLPSEEESGPEDAELEAGGSGDDEAKLTAKGRKRPTKGKPGNKRKRAKKNSVKEAVEELKTEEQEELVAEKEKLTEEEEKKKADSLWADFMKDVGPIKKVAPAASKAENSSSSPALKTVQTKTVPTEKENKVEKVKITQLFEFAGEKVEVTKEVAADSAEARLSQPVAGGPSGASAPRGRGRGGGLSAILSQIGKKSKLSTLEKTKLDWERFKSDEGLQEEIQTHNRGKDGYLEKQDFLQRADLRQFEIEKQLRSTRRSNR